MATAPRPVEGGYEARQEAEEEAQVVLSVTVRRAVRRDGTPVPETLRFAPNNLTFAERTRVRKETGLPLSAFVGANLFDQDSLLVLWWLARRSNGEITLTLSRAEEEMPKDLGEDDIDLEEWTPDEEPNEDLVANPESSGPAS